MYSALHHLCTQESSIYVPNRVTILVLVLSNALKQVRHMATYLYEPFHGCQIPWNMMIIQHCLGQCKEPSQYTIIHSIVVISLLVYCIPSLLHTFHLTNILTPPKTQCMLHTTIPTLFIPSSYQECVTHHPPINTPSHSTLHSTVHGYIPSTYFYTIP